MVDTTSFISKQTLYEQRICPPSKRWLKTQRSLIDAWWNCTEPEWLLSGLNIANLLYQTRLNLTIKLALMEIPLGIKRRPASAYIRRKPQADLLRHLRAYQRQNRYSLYDVALSGIREAAVRDSWQIKQLADTYANASPHRIRYELEYHASHTMTILSPAGVLIALHRMIETMHGGADVGAHAALDAAACTVIRQYVTVEHYIKPKREPKGKAHETD